jgi:type VI secretion system secreted protein VgrG
MGHQDYRSVSVTTVLGSNELLFQHMSATEGLSQLFQLDLTLLSTRADIDPDKLLGKPLTVEVEIQDGKKRFFHGLVTEFAATEFFDHRTFEYRAVVRPWFWFLTRTADCRIFQNKTVPDIFKEVCQQAGFTDIRMALSGKYEAWQYCVQYRETDFNFLSRLLEQEGIFYFFEHERDKHTLVLADDVARLDRIKGYETVPFFPASVPEAMRERDHLRTWSVHKSFHPGKYATRDYDFEKPTTVLEGTSSIARKHDAARYEIYDYPAEAQKLEAAGLEAIAKVRVQELQTQQLVARGEGDAMGLAVGKIFQLTQHPRDPLNIDYLVASTTIDIRTNQYATTGLTAEPVQFNIAVTAADAREPYRPARVTPKPVIHGTQTAEVVGTSGEEIYTDEYARVKVQFHWDRYGSKNENSSCWIRVGTPWAGKQWGAISIPRIGQEVIVSFLEGDPDQPIIIGSLYNGANKPPYALPANKTQSGIKTRSSLNGTADNFNEIRFEDKKGSEQLFIHAEKDQVIEVENDEQHSVGHDRTKEVKNNETTTIGKNRTETVGDNEKISVGKDRSVNVGENEKLGVGKDQSESIGGNRTLTVGKNESITVEGNRREQIKQNEEVDVGKSRTVTVGEKDNLTVKKTLMINAGDEITIKTGSASITMKKDGTITIKGKNITVDGSGKINVKASGDVVVKGSKVTQN